MPPNQASGQQARRPAFREKPGELVSLIEGDSTRLRCELDNHTGTVQWLKDGHIVFMDGEKGKGFERHFMEGDQAAGDFSMDLRRVRLEDSGHYECQAVPVQTGPARHELFIAKSLVTVRPQVPLPPPPAPAQTTTPSISSAANQSLQWAQEQLAASGASKAAANQLQQRDLQNLPKLQTGPTALLPSAFITPHASSATSAGSQPTYPLYLILNWPYVLLMVAGLLMLANFYLIYSLIMRHRRNTDEAFSQRDSSLESGSNGGSSASGSAGTGSSHVGPNELSNCDLEASIEAPPDLLSQHQHLQLQQQQQQQQLQLQMQQQHQQLQLQSPATPNSSQHPTFQHPIGRLCVASGAWSGQEFVAIDPNGWVLEI